MPQRIKNLFIFILSMLCLFSSTPPGWAADDTIVAVVNDDVVTLHDLHNYYNSIYLQLWAEGMPKEEIEKKMAGMKQDGLEQLIEDRLIIQTAKKKGVEIRDKIIDERLEEIQKRYPSEQDFLTALTRDGATITDLRTKIQERFLIQYIVDLEVRSKIFVNPQEVTEYYNAHLTEFAKSARANLDSIFIPFKNVLRDEARQKAMEAMDLLKQRKDFREVARQFSSTPSVGIVTKGELIPEIESKVFTLNTIGEMTDPIETETGIFIFQLKHKLDSQTVPYI